jgi:hypothetical protein
MASGVTPSGKQGLRRGQPGITRDGSADVMPAMTILGFVSLVDILVTLPVPMETHRLFFDCPDAV